MLGVCVNHVILVPAPADRLQDGLFLQTRKQSIEKLCKLFQSHGSTEP